MLESISVPHISVRLPKRCVVKFVKGIIVHAPVNLEKCTLMSRLLKCSQEAHSEITQKICEHGSSQITEDPKELHVIYIISINVYPY